MNINLVQALDAARRALDDQRAADRSERSTPDPAGGIVEHGRVAGDEHGSEAGHATDADALRGGGKRPGELVRAEREAAAGGSAPGSDDPWHRLRTALDDALATLRVDLDDEVGYQKRGTGDRIDRTVAAETSVATEERAIAALTALRDRPDAAHAAAAADAVTDLNRSLTG